MTSKFLFRSTLRVYAFPLYDFRINLRYQSINQSIFISGTWPIKEVEKTDRKYLQQIDEYKTKP